MVFDKACMEFEAASFQEVKLLLRTWYQVLTQFKEFGKRGSLLTQYRLVTVGFDDCQRPDEVVFLRFIAPQRLLDKLVDDLKAQGLECPMEVLVPGFLAKCRVQKKLYAHPAVTK